MHHGTDDVALGVELASVAGRVGRHALEQVFVDFRKHNDIGLAGEVQSIDLLHYLGKAHAPAAVIAHVVEDAAETLGQRIIAQAFGEVGTSELDP
ncbi:hypothetical protein D3C76_1353330 [compost metagenome]